MSPAAFDLNSVEAAIAATRFAGSLVHLSTTPSTNTLALEAAQSGSPTGVWVADEQTAGRGRGGHTWHSSPGEGLYLSALIRPRLALTKALWLSLATGLAVQRAIATTGISPDIRWPNDLLLNGRKCGGILVETASDPATSTRPATLRYAVIGIGINLNHQTFPPELESLATSIALETRTPHSREPLITAILKALDKEISALESTTAPDLLARFTSASSWITGKRVCIQPSDTAPGYTGTTAGLDPNGFLRVTGDDGQVHIILSGGVREP
jgi:BirA family transcriptional regulator, biotin operon repressor / biotin---[acetyl-CoA-carboxylase] ligase